MTTTLLRDFESAGVALVSELLSGCDGPHAELAEVWAGRARKLEDRERLQELRRFGHG